jgi:hypothetical protein
MGMVAKSNESDNGRKKQSDNAEEDARFLVDGYLNVCFRSLRRFSGFPATA